jgi:ubiquitin-protein ligase
MPASPNQLDQIYRQVREHFVSHPVISVNPTKGDPPNQYEITYTIAGMCKTGEGKIVESIDHRVELAIPFGFPHFPPSCKPKSDIFHPDFDPVAICLGDYWGQDRSLPDLIIHIGQMINGEIYSTANAFNEDAAEWYLGNSGKFPLAKIKWETENGSTSSCHDHIHEIDTLDDADLATEFDGLALEEREDDEDIILDTAFPEVDSSTVIDLEELTRLGAQKKYYTLLENGESNNHSSDELSQLCRKARANIQKAEKLHREGKKFENTGDAQIALEKYQQIETVVTDFPAIDSDIRRVKQTLALLNDNTPDMAPDFIDSSGPAEAAEATNGDKKRAKPVNKATLKIAQEVKAAKFPAQEAFFVPKSRNNNKMYLILFLGLLAIGIGASGYFWYSFTNKLNEAESAYAQCSTSYDKNQFDVAKRLCDKALQFVDEVKFIHQNKTNRLKTSIVEILQSEKLTQGLAGNILFEGKYIPKDKAKTILSIKQNLNEADTLYLEEKWQPALELYQILLDQAGNNGYLDPPVIEDIQHKHLIAKFRMSYDPAQVSMYDNQWEDAIEKLLEAQKILVSLPESDREQYSAQLQDALQKSQFANLKEQGDQSFTGADWLKAIASYNLALNRGQESALSPESIDAIRNNIKRAELYTAINKGNKAFASASWDDAIEAYSKASSLLMGNQGLSSETGSDLNIRKLARIILQASIIRDRQTIQALLEQNDLVKTRSVYQQILTAIANSTFKTEKEFINTTAEISKAVQALDQKIILMKRVEYLQENYQSLFVANYPAAIPEKLTNPVISNTKETKSELVFRMQCTENSGGRPLTLVMFYAYDKKTGKWRLFSEN